MADLQPRARHVPVEQRAEVVLFAEELKRLFDSIGMSLGAFCAGSPIDKGTLSRYLNGKRVPQGSWLLERLFALYAESGDPLTEEVRAHLVALQLAALEVAHPHEYKVRIATDELGHARIAIRESERHIASLEGELAERTRLLTEATSTIQHLRDTWDTERLNAQHEITSLRGELDDLTAQLRLAYDNHERAVTRQRELQQLLERLDSGRDHATSGSHAEQTTGVRIANAIEALASEDPDHRKAAVEALGEKLNRADLSGADLSYADLSDANLSDANLYGADPRNLVWSNQTVWPSPELERWLWTSGGSANTDGRLKAGSHYGRFPDDLTGGRPVT